MGSQWGDIYLCVPPTEMLVDVSPRPPIIAAPARCNGNDMGKIYVEIQGVR